MHVPSVPPQHSRVHRKHQNVRRPLGRCRACAAPWGSSDSCGSGLTNTGTALQPEIVVHAFCSTSINSTNTYRVGGVVATAVRARRSSAPSSAGTSGSQRTDSGLDEVVGDLINAAHHIAAADSVVGLQAGLGTAPHALEPSEKGLATQHRPQHPHALSPPRHHHHQHQKSSHSAPVPPDRARQGAVDVLQGVVDLLLPDAQGQGLLAGASVEQLASLAWATAKLNQQLLTAMAAPSKPQHIQVVREGRGCAARIMAAVAGRIVHLGSQPPPLRPAPAPAAASMGPGAAHVPRLRAPGSGLSGPLFSCTPQVLSTLLWAIASVNSSSGGGSIRPPRYLPSLYASSASSSANRQPQSAATQQVQMQKEGHPRRRGGNPPGSGMPAHKEEEEEEQDQAGSQQAPPPWVDAVEALSGGLLATLGSSSLQDLGLTAWALVRLGPYRPIRCGLIPALAQQAAVCLQSLSATPAPQQQQQQQQQRPGAQSGLGGRQQGAASSHHHGTSPFSPSSSPSSSSDTFSAQGVSLLAWGLGHLLQHPPHARVPATLYSALELSVTAHLPHISASPQAASQLAQGLHLLGHRSPRLWQRLQQQVASAPGFNHMWGPEELAGVLGAYARSRRPCPDLLSAAHAAIQQWEAGSCAGASTSAAHIATSQPSSTMSSGGPGHESLSNQQLSWVSRCSNDVLTTLMWAPARLLAASGRSNRRHTTSARSTHKPLHKTANDTASTAAAGIVTALAATAASRVAQLSSPAPPHTHLTPAQISHMCWAVSAVGTLHEPLLSGSCSHAAVHLGRYTPRDLSALTAAAAHLGYHHPGLWEALAQSADTVLPRMHHTELAALCAAAARLRVCEPRLMGAAAQLVVAAVGERAQRLRQAHLRSAASHLFQGPGGPPALNALPDPAPFDPAAATAFLEEVAVQQRRDLGKTEARAASRSPAGAALTTHQAGVASPSAAAASGGAHVRPPTPSIHLPTPSSLATLLWSFSMTGFSSPPLFQLAAVMVGSTPGGCNRLSPDQLHKLLWAIAAARWYDRRLTTALCDRLAGYTRSLTPSQLVDTAWALAALRTYHAPLLQSVAAALKAHQEAAMEEACQGPWLTPQEVAQVTWAVGYLAAGAVPGWSLPQSALLQAAPFLTPQQLALTLWGLAMQQHVLCVAEADSSAGAGSSEGGGEDGGRDSASSVSQGRDQEEEEEEDGSGSSSSRVEWSDGGEVWAVEILQPTGAAADSSAQQDDGNLPPAAVADELGEQQEHDQGVQGHSQGSVYDLLGMLLGRVAALGPQDLAPHPRAAYTLAAALSSLLTSHCPGVRAATARAVVSDMSPDLRSMLTRSLLMAAEAGPAAGPSPGGSWVPRDVTQLSSVRAQVAQVLRHLGHDPVPAHPLEHGALILQAPARSHLGTPTAPTAADQHLQAAVAHLPPSCEGLILLPHAQPAPAAIIIAPPSAFARSTNGGGGEPEPLGALLTRLTLLSEAGWATHALDARVVWGALRASAPQQRRYLADCLARWGISL